MPKNNIKNTEFISLMENPPVYDGSKPFYEQDKEVLDFYEEEFIKITEGFYIDDVFIHPWLYWHLNYFKTPIPIPKKDSKGNIIYEAEGKPALDEVVMNPPLDDHFYYFLENYKRCPKEQKAFLAFGCRGFSKSSIIASNSTWLLSTKENGKLHTIGGNDGDLNDIATLLETGFDSVPPPFNLPRNISDWSKHLEFGVKTKSNKHIIFSHMFIKNAAKGSKNNSEKGAGGSPIGFNVDEIGKWSFLGPYKSGLPAFKTQYGWKAYPLLMGTGGNNTLSKDAKKVLKNPSAHDMLEMDWDILNAMVPLEHRTWEEEKFGIFVPGQMSYRLTVPKIKTTFAKFLGVKSKYLEKIEMYVTDWEACNKHIFEERERLKKDEDSLNKFKMYHPINVKECFLESAKNPFPVKAARRKLDEIEESGNVGQHVELFRGEKWLTKEFSDKQLADDPHPGGEADAPVVIYNNHEFPESKPPAYTNVGGMDGYKTDLADTDSVGAFYILKRRNLDLNEPCERILVSYAARPPRMTDFHKQCETITEGYGAQTCMESVDTGFIQHLDTKGKALDLLTPAINFSESAQKRPSKGNSRFGIYPTKPNQTYMFNLFLDYCKEQHLVDIDEHANEIYKLGIEFIEDPDLLREIIRYKPGGNHDRMIAFMHALTWCRELDKKGFTPKVEKKTKPKKRKPQRVNTYGRHRYKPY